MGRNGSASYTEEAGGTDEDILLWINALTQNGSWKSVPSVLFNKYTSTTYIHKISNLMQEAITGHDIRYPPA